MKNYLIIISVFSLCFLGSCASLDVENGNKNGIIPDEEQQAILIHNMGLNKKGFFLTISKAEVQKKGITNSNYDEVVFTIKNMNVEFVKNLASKDTTAKFFIEIPNLKVDPNIELDERFIIRTDFPELEKN